MKNRSSQVVGGVLLLAGAFVGCECEEAPPPKAEPKVLQSGPAAEPIRPPIAGWFCEGSGALVEAPKDGYRAGALAVLRRPNWEDPEEGMARFLNLPGVRDIAQEGAFMVMHRLPGTPAMAVISAKTHEFPPGTTFDAAGAQKAFDEVAASPRAVLLGSARALTWGGRPAVEGAVKSPSGVVHHMILPTEGLTALDVIFVAPEADYHRYLAEACELVAVVK